MIIQKLASLVFTKKIAYKYITINQAIKHNTRINQTEFFFF